MSGWSELFRGKSSIYALDEVSKEWVDRGISGQLIMFQNQQFRSDIRIKWSKNQREIWWRLMNGKLKPKGERAWVLKAWDTQTNKQEILAIRFSDVQLSQQFSVKFHQIFPAQPPPVPKNAIPSYQPPQQPQQPINSYGMNGLQGGMANLGMHQQPQQPLYGNAVAWNVPQQPLRQQQQQPYGVNGGYEPQEGQTWECAVCTYSNHSSKTACIMCGLNRKEAPRQNRLPSTVDPPISPRSKPQIAPMKAFPFGNDQPKADPVADFDRMNGYVGHPLSPVIQHKSLIGQPQHNNRRNSWICPMCTLHNSINVTRCEACNASRNDLPNGGQPQPSYPNYGNGNPYQMHPAYQQPQLGNIGGLGGMGAMGGMGGMGMGIVGMMPNPAMPNIGGYGNGNGNGGGYGNGLPAPAAAKKSSFAHRGAATVQEFQNSASDIACYNDNPSQVFSTLRSVAKKLLKDDVRYRTLDTTNPKVMERLIGFEGVLDFLMLLGFESDAMGMKLICEEKPSRQVVSNAIEVLNTYESRLGLGRSKKKNDSKPDDERSMVTLGGPGPNDNNGSDGDEEDTLTLEQIIIWSTHENMRSSDTMETLILTHKLFTNSLTLLKNLRRRFEVPIPPQIKGSDVKVSEFRLNVEKRIQLKVIKSLRDWMKQYWNDFLDELEVQKELKSWLQELNRKAVEREQECPWIRPLAQTVSKEYERFRNAHPNAEQQRKQEQFHLDPNTGVPRALAGVSVKKGFKLGNVTAEDLADQITLMDYQVFAAIAQRECIGQCWKKRKAQSPNVLAMIQQFNNLTVFVQLQILSEKSLRDRGKAIKRVIKMGERFKAIKNYNSLCAVLGALNSSPIHRLKAAWSRVPEKQLALFEGFKQIFVNTRNFRNFRQLFRNVSPPAIPYFGLFLQDLVFIDDGNELHKKVDNFKQHGAMVNFSKCVRTMDRIKNIRLYQTNPYSNLKSQDFLQKILYMEFHKMQDFTEDTIWDMSTAVKKSDEGGK